MIHQSQYLTIDLKMLYFLGVRIAKNISTRLTIHKLMVVIFGMLFLLGSSGLAEKMCQEMMTQPPVTQHDEMPDCPTKQGDSKQPIESADHCDSNLLCDCSINMVSVKDNTIVVQKLEVSEPDLTFIELIELPQSEPDFYTQSHPIIYSSPPLFLTNESFLI